MSIAIDSYVVWVVMGASAAIVLQKIRVMRIRKELDLLMEKVNGYHR